MDHLLIWTSNGIDNSVSPVGVTWGIWCETCNLYVDPENPLQHDLGSFYETYGQAPDPYGRPRSADPAK